MSVVACLAMQSGSCGALGGRIMDPWRLATPAQRRINFLAGSALASCVFAWLAGFGSTSIGDSVAASIENAGGKSIVERHEATPIASTVANAAIGGATAVSVPEKATDM